MRKTFLFFLLLLIASSLQPTSAKSDTLYVETKSGYSYLDGVTMRFDSKREFSILEFEKVIINGSSFVNIVMVDESGLYQNITQPLRNANFGLRSSFLSNGSLHNIYWSIFYIRDSSNNGATDPFARQDYNTLTMADHRRFDLRYDETFFSVNLQYYEYVNYTGVVNRKIKVNTELSTKNDEDGMIDRSSIHIIKRDAETLKVISEMDYVVQRKSIVARYSNYLDQPVLWLPLQLLGWVSLVVVYLKIYKFRNKYEIIISKREK